MGNNVLIVDSNREYLGLIQAKLSDKGYSVCTASNGKEALNRIQNILPNLIISEVEMPIMDGLDLFKALKKEPETSKIPIIFMTHLEHLGEYFKKLDTVGFIKKPIDDQKLYDLIKIYCKSI